MSLGLWLLDSVEPVIMEEIFQLSGWVGLKGYEPKKNRKYPPKKHELFWTLGCPLATHKGQCYSDAIVTIQ